MPLVIEATWLVDPPTEIALSNEPDADRVVQRDIGQTYTTLSLNGTYTGGTPGTVEARVRTNAGATVVDWTVVAAAPSGGIWAGSLVIPTCEDVKIEVRCSRNPSVSWSGSHRWHVGIVFIGDGQSDFLNFMATIPPTVTASVGTSVYSAQRGWLPASTISQGSEKIGGAGFRTFLNFIKAETGVPCGMVYGGASGVGIVDMIPGSANFDDLASYIAGSGGKAEAFLWHHGPGDAAAFGVEPSVYVSNFSTLHQAIADLIGRTTAQCPAFVSSMQSTPSLSYTDENWYEMQQTLVRLGDDLTNVYYAASMYDAGQFGDGHISGDEWVLGAQRYGQTVATILYGTESAVAPWFPVSATRIDATHTRVNAVHSLGTDFTPTAPGAITGWRITGNNGLGWEDAPGSRFSADEFDLEHSDLGTVERALQYQYGTRADISGMVRDNSAIQSPLNFTKFYDLIAPGASALPVPHLRHISQRSRTDTLTSNTFANVEIGPADNDRYLIIPIVKGSNNALVTSVVLQVSGQSDLPLTVTTVGGSARGYHVVAHGNVPAAYGKTAQIVISYGASNFTTPTIAVYDVKMSSLSSTTPVVAFASDTDTDAVATLATSAGGFTLATAIQLSGSSTGGAFTGSETYAERLESAFETTRRVIADCSNTASNASNSATVTFDASANLSIGLAHWR